MDNFIHTLFIISNRLSKLSENLDIRMPDISKSVIKLRMLKFTSFYVKSEDNKRNLRSLNKRLEWKRKKKENPMFATLQFIMGFFCSIRIS